VDGTTVNGGTSEITLKVDNEFKCFTIRIPLFIVMDITWKSMSRGVTAIVDLAGK
jgi:hypothetical protein